VVCVLALGCDDDAEVCANACADMAEANCSVVPIEQSECEADCTAIRSGACRDAHDDLISCGGDEPDYVCNPNDSMTIAGCESEYDALIVCLDGP
jgi:hypothetical protein